MRRLGLLGMFAAAVITAYSSTGNAQEGFPDSLIENNHSLAYVLNQSGTALQHKAATIAKLRGRVIRYRIGASNRDSVEDCISSVTFPDSSGIQVIFRDIKPLDLVVDDRDIEIRDVLSPVLGRDINRDALILIQYSTDGPKRIYVDIGLNGLKEGYVAREGDMVFEGGDKPENIVLESGTHSGNWKRAGLKLSVLIGWANVDYFKCLEKFIERFGESYRE